MSEGKHVVSVEVPLTFYFLCGRQAPTAKQVRWLYLSGAEGRLVALGHLVVDGVQVVDLAKSQVNFPGLCCWLGCADADFPRRLAKRVVRRWPKLDGQLEVIPCQVEIVGGPYTWPMSVAVRLK